MGHVFFGLISICFAIWGLIVWWTPFGRVMRGLVPFGLLMFGLVSIASGLRRLQSRKDSMKTASVKGK